MKEYQLTDEEIMRCHAKPGFSRAVADAAGEKCWPLAYDQGRKDGVLAGIEWGEEVCPHGTLAADTSKAMKRECEQCWENHVSAVRCILKEPA